MARSLVAVWIAIAVVLYNIQLVAGFTPKPTPKRPTNPFDSFVGRSCRPPFGFRPKACGDYEVLVETVFRAPETVYGPNVCRYERSIRRNELEYEYSKYCDWMFSKSYHSWIQQCQLICLSTRDCSNRNQTIDITDFGCCPNFQTRPNPKLPKNYNQYYQRHFAPVTTQPAGCPIAVGDTIADCLMLHNLTIFLDFVEQSIYRDLINSNNSGLTVLAPTNEAFGLVDPAQLAIVDVDMLVGNHIINGLIPQADFVHSRRYRNLHNLTLHSTVVNFPDYSVITYSYPDQHQSVEFMQLQFINGAAIENGDACRTETENETLHIVNRVLMPSDETIADILDDDPQFSMFVDALMFAGTFDFLNASDSSHTIFAPTNDAFMMDIPPDLFNCLTSYMRVPLTNLILYHISKQTDYSQVLSLRQSAFSLFTDYNGPQYHVVNTAENGTLFLGSIGNQVPITQADIPASNGVIHVVDRVLMPPNFNYGQCQSFVPTTQPPTTQPPTMAPVTTDPASPMTTADTQPATTVPATAPAGLGGNDPDNSGQIIYDYGSEERNI